jgi:hypothetical protein
MAMWTVSEGPDPDKGEPFLVFETHDSGMLSFHLTKPGPVFITPDVAENVRIKLGAAILATRSPRTPQ